VGVSPPFVSGSRGCEPSGDGASAGVQQAAHVQEEQKAAEPVGGVRTEPNKGLELTAYSVRCAPASGSSSGPAFGSLGEAGQQESP
jgi:hypothetical protein